MSTIKNNPKYTVNTPLTALDRQIAVLLSITAPKRSVNRAVADILGVHINTVLAAWYKPAVQVYVAELIEQSALERVRIQATQIEAAHQAEYQERREMQQRKRDENTKRQRRRWEQRQIENR